MSSPSRAYNDPLTINLAKQSRALITLLPSGSQYSSEISHVSSSAELLATLSRLLSVESLTLAIAELFRPLLIDLCARWISDEDDLEERFVALCCLIENHEELFPVLFAFLRRPAFRQGPLAFVVGTHSITALDFRRLHRLLLAYYRLLRTNRLLPSNLLWSALPLSTLFLTPHPDPAVKYLAIRCYALHVGMAEVEWEKLELQVLGKFGATECPMHYGQNVDGSNIILDAWLMPTFELKRVHEARNALLTPPDFYALEDGDSPQCLSVSDLSPLVANIYGILVLRVSTAPSPPSGLIPTPSAVASLRMLAIHISLRVPIVISSPPSSGKSLFLSHIASVFFPEEKGPIVTVHLADTSLDPRSLLGSYVSSPTRLGSFEWKDGVIVRAMKEGKWLVFEDIDKGSPEVLGLIKPLAESIGPGNWIGARATIEVPNQGKVQASERFALFATRSVVRSHNGKVPDLVFYGAHKFHEVIIDEPSLDEVETIICAKFPTLGVSLTRAIIRLWIDVQRLGTTTTTLPVGLHHLERFCRRVQDLFPAHVIDGDAENILVHCLIRNPMIREEVYLEARDVFFGCGAALASAQAHLERVAALIADHLGLDTERRKWILQGRSPTFEVEKSTNGDTVAVSVGRIRLLTRQRSVLLPPSRPFTMHRPAACLLSRTVTALSLAEPVLLTGETGTGKTSFISHLASLFNCPLVTLNLSHQTESSDMLGGFKPVDARVLASELHSRFLELFGTTFSRKKNTKFEDSARKAVQGRKWKKVVALWREAVRVAKEKFSDTSRGHSPVIVDADTPRKRRKVHDVSLQESLVAWDVFERDINEFDMQHAQGQGKFTFDFVEGPLVKALRSGDWVLLDEINLASAETLECISSLLSGPTASLTLTEKGSLEPVHRHPDFRLFACMNPATDVGKKDLPLNIRARFTEIDVPSLDTDQEALLSIINQYIGHCAVGDKVAVMDVAEFYAAVKKLSEERQLADGSDRRPHFSMRTLARALIFAADISPMYGLRRALWEGCLMAFTLALDGKSAEIVTELAQKYILSGLRNPKSLLAMVPGPPLHRPAEDFVKFGPFYLEKGSLPVDQMEDYIMTPSVEKKLIDLARIVLTRRFPVLIEGPTSSGKTSAVEYLARRTGHQFVRINNHEHTDIQEYIGSYVSDPVTGKLVFKDGLLVHALRRGHWIVLDELNLAPTEVLEALNRLLDDNRELHISETQEVVRPHPHFMLFATQNPPGLYAGRKILSRAFRSRFLEVHFPDVPQAELETILCQRCRIAPSHGQRIVTVFCELQKRRQIGRVFESKQGFVTLRDLFRWAGRDAVGYQGLAENGYMLLAERVRREEDRLMVKEVIESVMKVRIDERNLYDFHRNPEFVAFIGCPIPPPSRVVWTYAMRRLFVLVARALRFNEPVLLVGETGSGKTSVCQLYAEVLPKRLHTLNCHQNTETADIIGGLRPARSCSNDFAAYQEAVAILQGAGIVEVPSNAEELLAQVNELCKTSINPSFLTSLQALQSRLKKSRSLFEWQDGPLVRAMYDGDVFLLDEVSLADDSVLERLNSVLEPERTIVLAERGGTDGEYPAIRAAETFKLIATMNPGGDYGKKELSPALRNRFTEIWVPPVDDHSDLETIIKESWKHEELKPHTTLLLAFCNWLRDKLGDRSVCTLRDILAWVAFSNAIYTSQRDTIHVHEIFHHAARMTVLDGLGSLPQTAMHTPQDQQRIKDEAVHKLNQLAPLLEKVSSHMYDPSLFVQLGPFAISKGPKVVTSDNFNFQAPTAYENAMRVVRACQLDKPILLEGSPGVGKTSLITALARLCGYTLCRINLSDQTDLIDLFGSDLPVENGAPGEFAWRDSEFLRAMQEGHWVLLDEMNLAPQTVLEGLNAILDHRGTVFIPELGRTFVRHPSFRVFAAQNPLHQGGGRKGLPKSFLDRFTKVYVDELSADDMLIVCRGHFKGYDDDTLRSMITCNTLLSRAVVQQRLFGREGSPWEFNLRDVIRWGELLRTSPVTEHPRYFFQTVYLSRFRTVRDRTQAQAIFDQVFSVPANSLTSPSLPIISGSHIQIGRFSNSRRSGTLPARPANILQVHLADIETVWACLSRSWLVIVTGQRNSGKSSLIRTLAGLSGNHLEEVSVTVATDTTDILGGFEQVDPISRAVSIAQRILQSAEKFIRSIPGVKRCCRHYDALRRELASAVIAPSSVLRIATSFLEELSEEFTTEPGFDMDIFRQHLCSAVHELSRTDSSVSRFEWVDGPLVRAMKDGHWLVLDGANLCNPSVLDRLNSLCEPNGFLGLNERGFVNGRVEVLEPHPDFRLLMTVDPQYGELSRAMRNRGLEVSLSSTFTAEDQNRIQAYNRLPQILTTTDVPAHAAHEERRRGVLLGKRINGPIALPPMTLLDDSMSESLVTFAPIIDSEKTVSLPAIVHFVTRAVPLSLLPALHRYFRAASSHRYLDTIFKDPSLADTAVALARVLRKPSRGVVAQLEDMLSLDDSKAFLPCSQCTEQVEYQQTHVSKLQVLDVFSALIIDQFEKSKLATAPSRPSEEQPGTVKEVIQLVVNETRAAAQGLLKCFMSSAQACRTDDFAVAAKLLGFSRQLRYILAGDNLDYSAISILTQLIVSTSENHSHIYDRVSAASVALDKAISPSSGRGLFAIWSSLRCNRTTDPAVIRQLETALYAPQLGGQMISRRQCFQALALGTLPMDLAAGGCSEVTHVSDQIKEHLSCISLSGTGGETFCNPVSLLVELQAICEMQRGDIKGPVSTLLRLLHVSLEESREDIRRFVPYQHIVWAQDARHKIPANVTTTALIYWLESLWHQSPANASLDGPSILFRPTHLFTTFDKCQLTGVSLSSLEGHEASVQRHLQLITLQCYTSLSRRQQLTIILNHSIATIASCFSASLDECALQCVRECMSQESFADTDVLLDSLGRVSFEPVQRALQHFLLPLRCPAPTSQEMVLARLGRYWIAQSRVILDLFVPDVPVDPAVMLRRSTELLEEQAQLLTDQIILHTRLELRTTGNEINSVISYLSACVQRLTNSQKCSSGFPPRNSTPSLSAFWLEVAQFMRQIIDCPKIDDLALALESNDVSAFSREDVVQQSISGFTRRLINLYPEFDDLVHILRLALSGLKLGLRLVRLASEHKCSQISGNALATSLVAFPPVRSAFLLQSQVSAKSGLNAAEHLLLTMAAVAYYHLSSGLPLSMTIVQTTYEQAYRLWAIDRTRDEKKEQDLGVLYHKSATAHDASSEEAMEKEFLELFPTYEDALSPVDSPNINKNMTSAPHHLSPSHHRRLFWLHLELMNENEQNQCDFNVVRRAAMRSFLSTHITSLPDSLDRDALHEQIDALHGHLGTVGGPSNATASTSNFYSAANVPEARKALRVIQPLRSRLVSLLQEWPDQMVLQLLLSRCDAILSFDFTSPVAKMLSALEHLLMQTEDWEMFANRENSLKFHQRTLIDVVVEWRRLELSQWKGLLESESRMFTDAVSEHWFSLYELLICGPLSAVEEDPGFGLSKYLRHLPSLLDDFIRTSSLGQFQARLTLLKSFETFISRTTATTSVGNSTTLHYVWRIVHFTWRSFQLFLAQVSLSLGEKRRSLEKEVETFIKLASWKDVNVQILQQSARKTHHQLYKIIRKFRDVLREPVVNRLTPLFTDTIEGVEQAEKPALSRRGAQHANANLPNTPFGSAAMSGHLGNLHQTLEKFRAYIDKSILQFLVQYAPHDVSQLSSNVTLMTQDLSDQTIPGDLSKEKREKYKKNLLTCRRKVWSDLQRELKRGGLTYRVKPDVVDQLKDDSWIRGQPLLPPNEGMVSLDRGERYFDRLRGCLPVLRDSLVDHHSDLSARDLGRGISLIESGYFLALETRATLAQTLSSFSVIQRQITRLRIISEATAIVHIETPGQLELLRNALSISARSLEELVDGIRTFSKSQDDSNVMDLAQDIQALSISIRTSRDCVRQALERSQLIIPAILLHEEYTCVTSACHALSSLSMRLDEMAKSFPQLSYILRPTQEWIRDQGTFSFPAASAHLPAAATAAESLIDTLLVSVQNMLKRCLEIPDQARCTVLEVNGPIDNYIRMGAQTTSLFVSLLRLPALSGSISATTAELSSLPHQLLQEALQRILPFLQHFLDFSAEVLESEAKWTSELFKLDYVLCSLVHTLATRGFCIPPETCEDDGARANERGQDQEGTGIGEGAGTENVSGEIKDESQVEGLQGDESDTLEGEKGTRDRNMIEMSENFEGELEDVASEQEDDENEGDLDDEDVPDEQLGELHQSDPDVVDEKLWGGKTGEHEEGSREDELHQDRSQQIPEESEIAAKEGKRAKEPKEKTQEDGKDDESHPEEGSDEQEGENGQDDEQAPPNAAGAPMDEHVPDANTLDLPEDMNLGGDSYQEDTSDLELGEDTQENEDPVPPPDGMDEGDDRDTTDGIDDDTSRPNDEEQANEQHSRATEDSQPDETSTDNSEKDAIANPDLTYGEGDGGAAEDDPQQEDSAQGGQRGAASTGVQESSSDNERSMEVDMKSSDTSPSQPAPQPPSQSIVPIPATSDARATNEGSQQGQALGQHSPASPPTLDPLHKLGDALKEIQQRFDEILGAPEQAQSGGDVSKPDDAEQVMYDHDENEDGMQALGPAAEEQATRLRELSLVEKNRGADEVMDVDVSMSPRMQEACEVAMEYLRAEKTASLMDTDLEGAVAHTESDKGASHLRPPSPLDPSTRKPSEEVEPEPEPPSISDEAVRAALGFLPSDSNETDLAAYTHLWALYRSLTAPLSIALCESLRLILAPTIATRLRGDFRTGKRLNMRRVIAWVASEYTKDCIWLRRVKPSARAYQVLLAVDDSASMRGRDGGAVHLAYQTVVLVTQALGRLEAGEVGIARFGAGWEIVRGFGEGARDWGASPAAGGHVLSALTFRQQRTDIAAFVEGSLSVLEAAREAASAHDPTKDLWQLEIIISDGICQEHERLRRSLRRARSMRVLVVFIVLDALHNNAPVASADNDNAATTMVSSSKQSSILTLNHVSYRHSPTTGQLELTIERYLDSFPFEYYVVLREVETLPRVLADMLREFFERVGE